MTRRIQTERGAVSLFLVIFSALLITIITVAFIRIMIQNQQQATAIDLSKSALDSAYAGVEDAKRAIVKYKTQCSGADATTTECVKLLDALNSNSCDTLQRAGISGQEGDKEVLVQQTVDDLKLQQAYTCVKIAIDTDDYLGSLTPNSSRLIHLKSDQPFDEITVEWFSQQDLQAGLGEGATDSKVNLYTAATVPPPLPKLKDWPTSRPALMRLQLLQYGNNATVPGGKGFLLSDFDKIDSGATNNSTLFLYPANFGITTLNTATFSDDVRQSKNSGQLALVSCDDTFSLTSTGSGYACKVTIKVPNPIGATDTNGREAYLRVNELFNSNTSFKVTMHKEASTDKIKFSAVQPAVDSTGRANDLFRRVNSRIELEGSSIPNTEAAVDITGSLCKTFLVTDDPNDYSSGTCQDPH